MTDTLRSLRTIIQLECRGDFSGDTDEDTLVNEAINDAIDSIWRAMMQVHLAKFFGADSPVSFTLAAGQERVRLVTITDPTVAPVLAAVAGGALAQRTITGYYTYVTESGSETLPSPLTQFVVPINNALTVQLPNQNNIINALGWNFYAFTGNNTVAVLQNQQPIDFNAVWQEPADGVVDYEADAGQQSLPTVNNTADNLSWIAHMEIRTSDTLLRAWNQADIDSTLMRKMARSLPTASEYQCYVWELMNNGVLEFRPTAGLTFQPRYWYIAKPRRLRYDQAEIPYVAIPGVHKFIKLQAKSDLYLGVSEFATSDGWKDRASAEKLDIQQSLLQEMWGKNTRIIPYMT